MTQVALYEGAPPGAHCPPSELHTTALALVAEGWRLKRPQLVRRARRLLDAVYGPPGADAALPAAAASARAACALLLRDDALAAEQLPAEALEGEGGADAWLAAWLEGVLLPEWPECGAEAGAPAAADGGEEAEAEAAEQGAPLPIDLARDWFTPQVEAVIKVRTGSPSRAALRTLRCMLFRMQVWPVVCPLI